MDTYINDQRSQGNFDDQRTQGYLCGLSENLETCSDDQETRGYLH